MRSTANSWRQIPRQQLLRRCLTPPFQLLNPRPTCIYSRRFYPPFQLFYPFPGDAYCRKFHSESQYQIIPSSEFPTSPVSYTKILSQLSKDKSLEPDLPIHAHLTKMGLHQDSAHRNHLIGLYSKCCLFGYARKLVEESPERHLVSWSSLISGLAQNGLGKETLLAFQEMHRLGIRCNEFSFPSVIKACSLNKDAMLGRAVHGIVVITGFGQNVYVTNTLVSMYAKCGIFWDSRRLFDEIPERNVISWNALISCYIRNDFLGEAVGLFQEMVASGIRPDEFSLSNMINACSGLGDTGQGMKIHGYLITLGFDSEPFCSNALVDMTCMRKWEPWRMQFRFTRKLPDQMLLLGILSLLDVFSMDIRTKLWSSFTNDKRGLLANCTHLRNCSQSL